MSENLLKAKESVLYACKKMSEKGYALGTSGNISARVEGENLFVITPSSYSYEKMTLEDLVVSDMDGNVVEGFRKPSVEFDMHRFILMTRPEVNSVIHTHSRYATAAGSIEGLDSVPAVDIETALYLGGDIPVAPFAAPGSLELAANIRDNIGKSFGIIMANHGAIGIGKSMDEAMFSADNVERTCEMYLALKACGEFRPLPKEYLEKTRAGFLTRNKIQ